VILAASARCKYSCAVPRPIEQLRAIARSPRPTSNFNRRTSLILRTDSLLAGKRSPFLGEAACHCDVQRRCPVEIIPGSSRTRFRGRPETVRLHRGIAFGIIPEPCSGSPRNSVRNHPGIAFTFARIPHAATDLRCARGMAWTLSEEQAQWFAERFVSPVGLCMRRTCPSGKRCILSWS
jgi:hypothetical protein